MIDVIWNMLDQGPAHISENSLQIGLVIAASDRVFIYYLLDAPVEENVLYALRGNEVFNEAPSLGGVKVILVHRVERIQRAVAFGEHSDINVPAVLMRTVMGGSSAFPDGKISKEKVAGVRELLADSLYRVEQSANYFRGGIRPALVAQMVALKLSWKDNAIFQMPLIGTSAGRGKGLACFDEN
jgi:hypothetical protein